MKKPPSKVAHNRPRPFFSVLPISPNPVQIQPKSQFLFQKNLPPWDFSIMTLSLIFIFFADRKNFKDNFNYWERYTFFNDAISSV